ncbi:MAG: type 2 isopentenyl-diphosphate Delta-isomerase [Theionarchaea archaeon]|nr:type 2 isopentenyl-diphosphate Delta-isomerase [Theionarchaea archaeon]MBU7001250.1 type 2 isopentenyl-diphosphate Delta-isomerase [Theionarchaea archaeon]MBU7019859.1 type 2 isopentenyl-diphosphate Delta-isomerase [Theionarchaea archaeon]MBU7035259.1 type 2 isopentenyl-diphosphate Delta-isomerase [Theionarchaea archaeon]MBU7041517.1 type 2 isopentenyl-diphosphate Delta-isomerase [Theionarchaea archaeon]
MEQRGSYRADDSSVTEKRKEDHINICLQQHVESQIGPGFDDIFLIHRSVPEIDFSRISTEVTLFNRKLGAPLLVEGMTGGTPKSKSLNHAIAAACQRLELGMGVGSQRAMIEDPSLSSSYMVRESAPDILLIGNLGLPQFILGYSGSEARHAVTAIGADVLAVHLNPLQEAVQPEGDHNFELGVKALESLKEEVDIPIIAKETGGGMCREVAQRLSFLDGLDVGGLGGTSFSAVEYYRNSEEDREIAAQFWNWGIPTAVSIVECAGARTLIASGGIRTGIDIAKAIALGADCCGIALPALKAAVEKEGALEEMLNRLIRELKIAMFLCGCRTLEHLKRAPVVITGKTREFLNERGVKTELFARR